MAKNILPTNYQDDIMNESAGGKRKYRMIYNEDGTVSFDDLTVYDLEGSDYGAGDINRTNEAVNQSFDKSKLIRDMDAINALTQEGYAPDALALKDVSDNLGGFEFKLENGKKQVSTDGGNTWENFNSGSGIIAFGYALTDTVGTSAVINYSYDKNIVDITDNILTFKESGEYNIFLVGNGVQTVSDNTVQCYINDTVVYSFATGGGSRIQNEIYHFNVGDTFKVRSSKTAGGLASGYCIYEPYYPYGKPLIPAMKSNTTPSGECSASSIDSTNMQAYKAFDRDLLTVWCSAQSTTAWIQYKFAESKCVRKVLITNRASRATYALKTFIVQGSNDGSAWTDLTDTITSPNQNAGAVNEFSINNNNLYLYYRINATTLNNKYLEIAEIQFFE